DEVRERPILLPMDLAPPWARYPSEEGLAARSSTRTVRDIDDLLQAERPRTLAGRVHTDPELFDLELKRIFDRARAYVAHTSEIPAQGDFVARYVGADPVIVTRDRSGAVNVLLNVCSHRGGKPCPVDRGNATRFTCPYHGWIYENTGRLVGVP